MICYVCDRCGDRIESDPAKIGVVFETPAGWKAKMVFHLHPGLCFNDLEQTIPELIKGGGGQTDPKP